MSCRLPTVISGKKRSREIGISFERCFEPWETRRHDADGWAHQIEPLERLNAETIARDSTDSCKRRVSGENVLEAKEVHGAESLWPNPNLDVESTGEMKEKIFLAERVNSNDDIVGRMREDKVGNQIGSEKTGREGVDGIAVGVIQVENVDGEVVDSSEESGPCFLYCCIITFPAEVTCVEKTSEVSTEDEHHRSGAVVGVDGDEMEEKGGAGGRRAEGERLPGRREGEDAEQGEVEAGESGGEEGGGGAGAEERTVGPAGGEAASVIGVHMSQEVGLTPTLPPVHRYQTALHLHLRF